MRDYNVHNGKQLAEAKKKFWFCITLAVGFLVFIVIVGNSRASEVDQFLGDTKEVLGRHYEGSYGFDLNGDENKEKLAIGSQIIAWRFLAVQPLLTYAPNAADSRVSVELAFPLRLPRIPIGNNREIRDLIPKGEVGGWIDRIGGGFWGKLNLTDGGWRFGWRLGFGNGR